MNVLVAFFFSVDAMLKCLAYGVLLTPTAYLQVSARLVCQLGLGFDVDLARSMLLCSDFCR